MTDRTHDIVVIGGSTGAIDALTDVFRQLPDDFAASIFVTVHVASEAPGYLPVILERSGPLPARSPSGSERIEPRVIYVAPPDYHLLIDDGYVKLSRGPRENRHRPAIDPLFRSAARHHGSRVVGVILSGELDDGSLGLMAIKMRGGIAIVQDPNDALAPEMPRRAIRHARPDYVLQAAQIAGVLARLSREPVNGRPPEVTMSIERGRDGPLFESQGNDHKPGKPSAFACPECHGVLWEVEDGELLRFRCRVGHAYTAQALNEGLSETTEAALWASLRVLEEKAALLHRMAASNNERAAARYQDQAQGYERHAETIRDILKEGLAPDRISESI